MNNEKTQGILEITFFFYFKRVKSTAGNQDKYLSSSEALISVELEVDDALYLEHSSDNEYVGGRTSGS